MGKKFEEFPEEPPDDETDKFEKIFQESDALEKIKTLAVVKKHCIDNKISLKEFLLFYMLETEESISERLNEISDSLRRIEKNFSKIKDNI